MWWRCDARAKIAAAAAAPSQHLGLACVVDSPNTTTTKFLSENSYQYKICIIHRTHENKKEGAGQLMWPILLDRQNPMSLSNRSAVWSILAQFNSFNDLSTFLALNWFYSIIALYSLFCTSYQPETVACMHKELINKTSKHNINFPMIFMGKWHHPCTKKYVCRKSSPNAALC